MASYSLCVLGCGTMGIAILSGVLDSQKELTRRTLQSQSTADGTDTPVSVASSDEDLTGLAALPGRFIACVNRPESGRKLAKTFAGASRVEVLTAQNVKGVSESDVVLLCCKPQMFQSILSEDGMKSALEGKLVISILAGVTISQIKAIVPPSTVVVRAMPNTPCKIREGMTVLTPPPSTTPSLPATLPPLRSLLLSIFSSIGRARFLDEKHFDACTALAGSGPAFACVFLEAMADGGVMMGLPRAEALELAAQSMQGAARMVLQSGMHPAALKDSVTTPGGCTIAGLLTLEDGKVRSTVARTIQAASQHAAGLGQVQSASK